MKNNKTNTSRNFQQIQPCFFSQAISEYFIIFFCLFIFIFYLYRTTTFLTLHTSHVHFHSCHFSPIRDKTILLKSQKINGKISSPFKRRSQKGQREPFLENTDHAAVGRGPWNRYGKCIFVYYLCPSSPLFLVALKRFLRCCRYRLRLITSNTDIPGLTVCTALYVIVVLDFKPIYIYQQ